MEIITPPDFFQTFKDADLLLDTSIFIDAFLHPEKFLDFLNNLKAQRTTLISIDAVRTEFLKGAPNIEKYNLKAEFFDQIIDTCLPTTNDTYINLYKLIPMYREDGKSLSVTDLLLGATLMQYKKLFLLTKNTTEFPTNIFKLISIVNISYTKGLHSYGIYSMI